MIFLEELRQVWKHDLWSLNKRLSGVSIESKFSSQGGQNGMMRTNGRNDQEFVLKYVS